MRRLVIGIGNEFRGDDAAGPTVARGIRSGETLVRAGASVELVELWSGWDEVIVIDAMRSGAPPGTVSRFDAACERLPRGRFVSSHAMGFSDVVELARRLGRLPARLIVYGIEAEELTLGAGLSPAVCTAVEQLTAAIDQESLHA